MKKIIIHQVQLLPALFCPASLFNPKAFKKAIQVEVPEYPSIVEALQKAYDMVNYVTFPPPEGVEYLVPKPGITCVGDVLELDGIFYAITMERFNPIPGKKE